MTELLCKVCDREIFENESDYENYITTLRKGNDKFFYKKYTINNVNLDEFDRKINDYILHHNKQIDFCFCNCEFQIEIDKNFIANIEINYHYKKDTKNKKIYLLHYFDSCKFGGYIFNKIVHLVFNTFSYRCNMTYEYNINQTNACR